MSRVVIVPVSDGVNAIELATIVEVLRRAERMFGAPMPRIASVMPASPGVVLTSTDFRVVVDIALEDIDLHEVEAIVVPGGARSAETLMKSEQLLGLIRSLNGDKKVVAAICSASLVLAAAGVFQANEKVTSFHDARLRLEHEFHLDWINEPVVRRDNVVTGRGPGASLPFVYTVIELMCGRSAIRKIDERLVSSAACHGMEKFEDVIWSEA